MKKMFRMKVVLRGRYFGHVAFFLSGDAKNLKVISIFLIELYDLFYII